MKKLRIGILGGGQLGRMTASASIKFGHKPIIFSDIENSPASFIVDEIIIANYFDKKALATFANQVDIITFEFENIPVATIEFLEKTKKVYPSSKILRITQNRLLEKGFLNKIGIKTADFAEIKSNRDLLSNFHKFGKSILKTATLGYDGKGQFVLENTAQTLEIWDEILQHNSHKNQLILEKFCPFKSEISTIVARSENGEILCYEPLTNIHKNGILDKSIYPAQISREIAKNAQKIAIKIAKEINLIGILATEFFVMENGELLVNELAPRPHNSGHFSMDAAKTSQFEQLILAICDEKLGDPTYIKQGFMQNLIGKDVENLDEFEKNPKAKIYLYNKKEIKEGRKMGHVNVVI